MKYEEVKRKFEERKIHFEFVGGKTELMNRLNELIQDRDVVSNGGSTTLAELGVYEYLRKRDITYLDRSVEGVDVNKCYHDAFNADVYLSSSNAITKNGEIFNIDGNGNRVSALIYGPKKVIIVVGENKLVNDLAEARSRVKREAAPKNAKRLEAETPCSYTGNCADCRAPRRLCCYEVAIEFQREQDRMYVLMVEGSYGY